MDPFDRDVTVTLSTSQWLTVQCALSDARMWNTTHGFPTLADDIMKLKTALAEQTDQALNAAFHAQHRPTQIQ